MRSLFVIMLIFCVLINVNAQGNNPYSLFGYTAKNEYVITGNKKLEIKNIDTTAQVFLLYFDNATKRVCLKDKNGVLLMAKEIPNDVIAKWISVDPKASERVSLTPYNFVQNNPMLRIDPDGQLDFNPSEQELKANNLTNDDITRFKSVVDNISNIVKGNNDAMNAIIDNTGFSKEQILSDLEAGNGPCVNIAETPTGMSGTKTGIVVNPTLIKAFANIDPNNSKVLAEQTLGVAISLVHEYTYYGDEVTNATQDQWQTGQKSGEWLPLNNGFQLYDVERGKQNTIKFGKQNHKTSILPERGDAVAYLGYGKEVTLNDNGVRYSVKDKPKLQLLSYPPGRFPTNMIGTTILQTLRVK